MGCPNQAHSLQGSLATEQANLSTIMQWWESSSEWNATWPLQHSVSTDTPAIFAIIEG